MIQYKLFPCVWFIIDLSLSINIEIYVHIYIYIYIPFHSPNQSDVEKQFLQSNSGPQAVYASACFLRALTSMAHFLSSNRSGWVCWVVDVCVHPAPNNYLLVNKHSELERSTIFNGTIRYTWQFSIAM